MRSRDPEIQAFLESRHWIFNPKFQHEQSRPDRDTYIQIDLDNTNIGSQFAQMGIDWIDTGHPYELASVMHYCSWCGTNGQGPVMTTTDGETFAAGAFMTTTDALQFGWQFQGIYVIFSG